MISSLIMSAVKQAGVMAGAGQRGVQNLTEPKDPFGLNKSAVTKVVDREKLHIRNSGNFFKKMLGKGMGMTGISLSLSSLLRQSQIFTGTIGAVFQILGGFIDVILAPFMPILGKVIQMLGAQIPRVRDLAQKGYDWLEQNVFPVLTEGFDFLKKIWDKMSPDLFSFVKEEFAKTIDFWKEQWEKVKQTFSFITADLPAIMTPISDLMAEFGMKLNAGDVGRMITNVLGFITTVGRWQVGKTIDLIAWGIKYVLWPFVKEAINAISDIVQLVMNVWRIATDFDNYKDTFMLYLKMKWEELKDFWPKLQIYLLEAIRWIPGVGKQAQQAADRINKATWDKPETVAAQKAYAASLEQWHTDRSNEKITIDLTLNGQPLTANEAFGEAERRLAIGLGNQNLLADAGGFNEGGG
jgi:hypothetical protein